MRDMITASRPKLINELAIERTLTVARRSCRWLWRRALALLPVVLLAACGGNQMAFLSEGDSAHSLTIERRQAYFGGPWETALIVAGMPQCQRRYHLEGFTGADLRIDVYRPEPGVYILAAGQRWFVAELQRCGFQQYRQPPPEPGERTGSFEATEGALRYLPSVPSR